MKKTILFAIACFSFLLMDVTSFAQDNLKKNVVLEARDVQATRGSNPNIKEERPTTDDTDITRGSGPGTCLVSFDNYSRYTIDVYVDGYFKGTLSALGSGSVYVGTGYTTIYLISVGRTKEWFADGNCNGLMTYSIY